MPLGLFGISAMTVLVPAASIAYTFLPSMSEIYRLPSFQRGPSPKYRPLVSTFSSYCFCSTDITHTTFVVLVSFLKAS
ncbi:hypothetical protein D9M68_463300 [compost metagenome]